MPRLNEIQCAQIIALLEEKLIQDHIARRIGVNRSSIDRVYACYQQILKDFVEGADKVEVTSDREDRNIVNVIIQQ